MNTKYSILYLIIAFFLNSYSPLSGKEITVTGKITAFNKFALNKVSILVKSSNSEVFTDSTGCYTLKCNQDDKLTISAHGFFTEKLSLKKFSTTDSVNVNLRLKKGVKNIEYATGYGHISEKRLSYAIEHFESGNDYSSYNNILEILEGRVSGVSIGQNSITIRGTDTLNGATEALLVVDGTVVNFSIFKNIPPAQVKTIDILKGAAASARYGSRGMGGVVIVKTKTAIN